VGQKKNGTQSSVNNCFIVLCLRVPFTHTALGVLQFVHLKGFLAAISGKQVMVD